MNLEAAEPKKFNSQGGNMTYSLGLLFLKSSESQCASGPIAQLCVENHTSDERGNILITPYCVTLGEVEEQIERLKKELEIIRREAKKKFAKCKEKSSGQI